MKKIFLSVAVAAIMGAGMTSCGDKEQCWEIGPKVLIFVPEYYFYGTASEAEAFIKETYGTSLVISKKKVNLSEADCRGSID